MTNQASRSSKPGRRTAAFLAVTLIASAFLAFAAVPALAVQGHAFTGITIGPGGKSAAGQFADLAAVTADPSTGDLYVLDTANSGRLYKFDSEGNPLTFPETGTNFIEGTGGFNGNTTISNQVAIAPPGAPGGTEGDVYIANSEVLKIYSSGGGELGQIVASNDTCGVAVNGGGDIFTKSLRRGVGRYIPTGNPPTSADESGGSVQINETCNLAIDNEGHIFAAGTNSTPVGDEAGQRLWKLESLTAESPQVFDPHSSAVAVEPGTNDVYVSHGTEVFQYAPDGSLVAKFGEGRLAEAPGLSIAKAGGDVYVASRSLEKESFTFSGRIDVFGPLLALPRASAGSAETTKTSAVLNGTIEAAGGPQATCEFEYETRAAYQQRNEVQRLIVSAGGGTFTLSFENPGGGPKQTTAPIASDASAAVVQAELAALSNIRRSNVMVTGGPGDKTGSSPYEITLLGNLSSQNLAQISVNTSNLIELEGLGAQVQTVINGQPGGFNGENRHACVPGGPFTGTSAEAVSAEISSLAVGTEYVFRLVGENANGKLGSDENGSAAELSHFETLPAFAVQTGSVTSLTKSSVVLNGSINPEGVNVTECFFEYGKSVSYGNIAPCEAPGGGEIGSGNTPVTVHANVTGLSGSTEYHYRLVSGSSAFGGITVDGTDKAFGTLGLPEILAESFSGAGQTTITISGLINPHSSPTSYFVEYLTDASYAANVTAGQDPFAGAGKVPSQGVAIDSGFTGVEVSQVLSGLTPGTKYHFRLSAFNGVGDGQGTAKTFTTHVVSSPIGPCPENEIFRVEWSAALPDCRAYEQASSPDKNGDSVAGLYPSMFAAEEGSAVTFYSPAGALPPAERGGTQTYSTYLARRDAAAGSWSSQRLLPPEELGERAEFLGSTPDLRFSVIEVGSVRETGLYVLDADTGATTQIVPKEPKAEKPINQFGFDGASSDGSHIFFESTAALSTTPELPGPAIGHDNLYMWDRSTGDVSLVGVLPGGEVPLAGSFGGAYEWYEQEQPSTGGTLNLATGVPEPLAVAGLHAISPNGDQIFFTASGTGQLYLRRGLGGLSPSTTYISTPNSGVVGTPGKRPAAFQEATPDGSRAFFLSRQKLTTDAKTGPEEKGRDLYRWSAAAPSGEALTDVTPDPGGPNGAEVQGLLGVSASGSSGYFIARGDLGEGAQKGAAEIGGENIYRFTERANGHFRITFIATIAEGAGSAPDRRNVSPKVTFSFALGRTSRVSESGETLLFASRRQLTPYENFNLEGMSCEAGQCPELYLYSAQSAEVICVSCDPTEEAPVGAASLQDQYFDAYFTPSEAPSVYFSRNLSADGTKVFFQTPDALVQADENGRANCVAFGGHLGEHDLVGPGRCQDVYEWEAAGSGSCNAAEANRGCLYLLSNGQSKQPSYFVGASKDGSNVFIATDSQLVPADRDQADDVYDVPVGGGLASQHAIPPVPCASADACKGSSSPSPTPTPSATQTFHGPGNFKPKQCKKGFAVKKGRCVRKTKKQPKNSKRHHHRSHRATGQKRSGGAK